MRGTFSERINANISGMEATLARVIVTRSPTLTLRSRRRRIAASDSRYAPFRRRNSSWIASVPSMEMPTYDTPRSRIQSAQSSLMSVPFVENVTRNPFDFAYSAKVRMSGLENGSPPEKSITGTLNAARSSITARACPVDRTFCRPAVAA